MAMVKLHSKCAESADIPQSFDISGSAQVLVGKLSAIDRAVWKPTIRGTRAVRCGVRDLTSVRVTEWPLLFRNLFPAPKTPEVILVSRTSPEFRFAEWSRKNGSH
ncbi:hypothetical protein [Nocardia rosealba]|uniref:hypothetical protein n=1 Tax=Nocardia rosealba TaxID=2878563 RepID=UPI001CD9D305|nr:hypothetical protein [Nocardia rosealba]MCA2207322.1 hypothetical protein [Nocardia rosealba]